MDSILELFCVMEYSDYPKDVMNIIVNHTLVNIYTEDICEICSNNFDCMVNTSKFVLHKSYMLNTLGNSSEIGDKYYFFLQSLHNKVYI